MADDGFFVRIRGGRGRVVGVDAERALFVDVGMSHGDYHGIHRDIHHDNIENLKTDAETANIDYIESS